MDETLWYVQNRSFDVVAVVDSSGGQVEMVRYGAYGTPFALPSGDADSDGDCDNGDTVDTDQIQGWIDPVYEYDVRGDIDLDGDVDSADKAAASTGTALGWAELSGVGNLLGHGGRPWRNGGQLVRNRRIDSQVGRWIRRDPLGYVDGPNKYEAYKSSPQSKVDPLGLTSQDIGDFYWPVLCLHSIDIISPGQQCAPGGTYWRVFGAVMPGTDKSTPGNCLTGKPCYFKATLAFKIQFLDPSDNTWKGITEKTPLWDLGCMFWHGSYDCKGTDWPEWGDWPLPGTPPPNGSSEPRDNHLKDMVNCDDVKELEFSVTPWQEQNCKIEYQVRLTCHDCAEHIQIAPPPLIGN